MPFGLFRRQSGDVSGKRFIPTAGDWISHGNDLFKTFIPLGDKDDKSNPKTFFVPFYSNGLKTQRDSWCYNSSRKVLKDNICKHIDYYNEQRTLYHVGKDQIKENHSLILFHVILNI